MENPRPVTPTTAPTRPAGQDSLEKETVAGFSDGVEYIENKSGSDSVTRNDGERTFGDGLDHEHEPPVRFFGFSVDTATDRSS